MSDRPRDPHHRRDSDGVTDLTIPDGHEDDEETSDEGLLFVREQATRTCPERDGIGLKTARLDDGSHRVMGLAMGSSTATSGKLQIGEESSQIDDIDVVNFLTESVSILLAGSPGFSVYLHLISLGGWEEMFA